MTYYKNLNGHFTRPKKNIVIGLLLFLVSIYFMYAAFFENGFKVFYAIYALVLILNGVMALSRYKGIILWRKAYIKLDDEALRIKTISVEKNVLWKDIEGLDLRDNKLRVNPTNKTFQYVALESFDQETINEICEEITKFATLKNIAVIR